ncbi:MAG: response regulator [Pseudomonadota bacterium]
MKILIVESNRDLGRLWKRHLDRSGHSVTLAQSQSEAIAYLQADEVHVIILNVVLPGESSLAVSDFASYRWPDARVVFVTGSSFFSDGSIFQHASNACAFLPAATEPEDLASMVDHFGAAVAH